MKKSTERKMNLVVGVILGVQVGGVTLALIFNAVHKHRYHRDLLATKALTLQFIGPENIELQDPHAYARDEGLIVSGCLNRMVSAVGPPTSHVDIRLLSAKGAMLHEITMRDLSRCKRGGAHFSTRFPAIPTDGSVLSIKALADQEDGTTPGSLSPDPGG